MSETRIITCDQCGEKERFKDGAEAIKDGWIEVWDNSHLEEGGESMDFCTKICIIDYFSGKEPE